VKHELDARSKAVAERLALIILDLNFAEIDVLQLIRDLKSNDATKTIGVVGYVSHVQGERKQQVQEAGCDTVLARSAFSHDLQQILTRHAES
jgi:CheY-like chemotaxis protein